jgi:putative transposase
VVTPEEKKNVATYLQEVYLMSQRKTFRIVHLNRSSGRYQPIEDKNAPLVERIKTLAYERRRFGYRRIFFLLKKEGFVVNHKKIYRLYRAAGLMVRKRKSRKKAHGIRRNRHIASRPNERWSLDFIYDQLSDGRRIKLLTIMDEYTRESLQVSVAKSIRGKDVVLGLEKIIVERGKPQEILSDNGSEFTGNVVQGWAHTFGIDWGFIEPGKPVQNCFIESFNGKIRDECLNENWFETVAEAKTLIEKWRNDYNQYRPHSSLKGMAPEIFSREERKNFEKPHDP